MQTVIAVNLNGNAYQLEEPGYQALRAYLDDANAALADNPDRAEIVADLEGAIADKCGRHLGAHKTVVSAAEVEQILAEMGPVDGTAAGAAHAAPEREAGTRNEPHAQAQAAAQKRLYAIYDGAWLFGICNGVAAYFDLDPTIVRVAFVALAFLTGGFWILVYVALMFILPVARTPEEHAAAHGTPFNAQELVLRAKAKYAELYEERGIRREWKRQRRAWRLQRRAWRAHWRAATAGRPPWGSDAPPPSYAMHVLAGALTPVFIVLGVALFFAFAAAAVSLLLTGRVLAWAPPSDLPLWAALLILFLFYQLLAWPLHSARRATHMVLVRGSTPRLGLEGLVGLAVGLLCLWFAYHEVPAVHDFLRDIPGTARTMIENLRESWH